MASPGLLSALQQGMPIETYYNNIRNFASSARSPEELIAAAQQLGISGEDIMRATGESPLSTYSPDSNPSNFALAQALESIPMTIDTGVQYSPQTRDIDQGVAAQSDFNVMNPRTGQMENVTPASEFIPGAPANQFVVSSGQGVFEQDGKSYQPVNLVTVDQSGNVTPSGTFNIEKNELSDFAQVVGTGTKLAAVALGGYAVGSSILNAAGLGGTAAGTAAASADAAFVAADAAQLAAQGLSQGQIAQTLVAAGVNGSTAATAAGLAASGAGASTIAGSLTGGNLFTATAADLAASGITTGGTGTTFAGGAAGGSTAGGATTTGGATTGGAAAGGGGTGLTAGGGTAGGAAGGVAGGTGLTAGADAAATLGAGGAATGGLAGGVAGGTGLTAGAGGVTGLTAGAGALGGAAAAGAGAAGASAAGSAIGNAAANAAGSLFGGVSDLASTTAKLGAAAPLIGALVSGGLTQDTINSLKSLGSQAQTDYRNLATEATKDINFTPYGVTTGLFGSRFDPTTRTLESTYQPGVGEVVGAAGRAALGSFEQAGTADLNQMTADRMALYQQLVSPEQQRSRLAQEARLQAQGRLGVGAGGGEYAPELKALEDAIAKQNLQFALAAPQEALAQRGALITQGQAASQVPIQLQQQQLAQLQLGGQLGQQQAQTAAARGGLFGQYAGQGISENVLAQIAAAQVASERNKALGTALGGLFV